MQTNTQTLDLFADLPPAKPVAPAPGASQARAATRPVRDSYFNTTRLVGPQAQEYRGKAKSERELILQFFQAHPFNEFGPSDVFQRVPGIILNNVRRAITDLTADRKLEKMKRLQTGIYNRPEHVWRLRTETTMRDCA
jgi:hypothetical protein